MGRGSWWTRRGARYPVHELVTRWQRLATCCFFMEEKASTVNTCFPAATHLALSALSLFTHHLSALPLLTQHLQGLLHTACKGQQSNARVHTTGGFSDELWRFSTTHGPWELVDTPAGGVRPSPQFWHASAVVGDALYLHGGYNSYYNHVGQRTHTPATTRIPTHLLRATSPS